jgi:hypothetical protein
MLPNSPLQNGNAQMQSAGSGSGGSEQAVRQRRSREDMNEARQELSDRARTATDKRRKRDEKQKDLRQLEQSNAQFEEVNSSSLLGYYLAGLQPLFVWVIDVVLLNQAVTYLIGSTAHLGWFLGNAGIYLLPAAIILMEMLSSRQRLVARRASKRRGDLAREEDARQYKRLKWFSYFLAAAIPVLSVSAILASELAGTGISELSWVKWLSIGGMGCLAIAAHGSMVYAGDWIQNARGYLFYRLRRWRRRSTDHRAVSAYEDACSRVADQFDTYQEAHSLCDRLHPNEDIQLGPFSMHVRRALNDHYGFEYMAVPDGLGSGGDAPNTPPSPEPDSSGATGGDGPAPTPPTGGTDGPSGDGAMPSEPSPGSPSPADPAGSSEDASAGEDDEDSQAMADYYRSVAEAQRRDADGEVSL